QRDRRPGVLPAQRLLLPHTVGDQRGPARGLPRPGRVGLEGDGRLHRPTVHRERRRRPGPPRPEKIGVSGAPAWHLSLRGRVRPPRNTCTPPVIRFDTVAVSTRTPEGAPATIVFVLMADEGEQGVPPEETIDRVVASLRYDISV